MFRPPKKNAQDGVNGAIKAAVSLLSYKENTEGELFDKLKARGYSAQDAAGAISYVVSKNYLNESRYFSRFVENAAKQRYLGKRRIMAEAKLKGFSQKTLENGSEEAFSGLDFGALCHEALEKYRQKDAGKARAALLRRGYTQKEISEAFDRYKEEHGAPFSVSDGAQPFDGGEYDEY